MTLHQATWTAVEGTLIDGLLIRVFLASRDGQLWSASLEDDVHPRGEAEFLWRLGPEARSIRSEEGLRESISQMRDYFAGHRRAFDLPLHTGRGTLFHRKVWEHLQRIPYGETISYGELAEMIGHPGASRAVGTANGRNNLALVIPCHRVIAAGGKLGGYGGGLGLKRRLLSHEAIVCGHDRPAVNSPWALDARSSL